MKRRLGVTLVFAAAAAAVLTLLGPTASGSGSRTQATISVLRVGLTPPVANLDAAHFQTASYIASLGLEQLLQIGPDGKLKPWLAQKVTQPGRALYIYHLRKGVRFWDGSELTAADVANALNYNRDPGAQTAYLFNSVKDIRALDRYKVAFALKRPDASFKWALAQYPAQIFQKKFSDDHKGTLGRPGVLTMGTGPWRIVSLDPTRGAELVAHDRYWGGRPQIRRISIKFFADENSMALAFRAGEIDVAPLVNGPQAFATAANTKLLTVPGCQQGFFGMNSRSGPWSDVHVRRAVAYALNRTDLIKAKGGYASPNFTLIPRTHLLSIGSKAEVDKLLKSLPQYPFNLAKARQEMAQSRYPNGFTVAFPTAAFGNFVDIVQVIAAQLEKIGIKLDVKVLTLAAWIGEVAGPAEKRPAFFSTSGCNSPDPSFYPATYLGKKNLVPGSYNVANYAPADLEALMNAGVATSNSAKRLEIYGKLLRRLALDVPYVPLFVQNGNAAVSSKLTWSTFNSTWYNRTWALEIKPK